MNPNHTVSSMEDEQVSSTYWNHESPKRPDISEPRELHVPVGPSFSRSSRQVETSSVSGRKPRVALACKRCKRRKQRCDGVHPVCMSCERAGTPCIYERTIRPQYPGGKSLYISALEERIAFLEARLPAYAEDHFKDLASVSHPAGSQQNSETTQQYQPDSSSSHRGSVSDDVENDEQNSIIDGVAYLSMCASGTADTGPEPYYLGSSSGAAIARMIQKSIFQNARVQSLRPDQFQRPGVTDSYGTSPSIIADASRETSLEFPFRDQARHLFDIFFDRMHTRWPLLDRKKYSQLFEVQYDENALSITERSIMHLIYAIAARFEHLTRRPSGVNPETHLLAAIEPMDYILEQHNLATVQFLLLLAVHGQRSPYGAGAWSQVRYAVSLCIELGLHRERRVSRGKSNNRDLEIRRRAFWSCYSLDRSTSVILGRAFAISDRDINVTMPSPSPEFWDLTHGEPPDSTQCTAWSNIEPFIHIVKLERIQSRIHRSIFRVDKDVFSGQEKDKTKIERTMTQIRADLDQWIQTTPKSPKDNKKITWLYDPESANHDAGDFYNLCFIAGLTLIYCIWKDRSLFSHDVIEATQACSQSLTIFGEKWTGAVKYRDIFDALSGSLIKTLVNPMAASADTLNVRLLGVSEPLQQNKMESSTRSEPCESADTAGLQEQNKPEEPTMCDFVSDAVKEAFMEVDEEAPGGWQGWRMWNEMLGADSTMYASGSA